LVILKKWSEQIEILSVSIEENNRTISGGISECVRDKAIENLENERKQCNEKFDLAKAKMEKELQELITQLNTIKFQIYENNRKKNDLNSSAKEAEAELSELKIDYELKNNSNERDLSEIVKDTEAQLCRLENEYNMNKLKNESYLNTETTLYQNQLKELEQLMLGKKHYVAEQTKKI